ncbi:MFS transporter [Methylopila jiangsuensis]|uniref:MFS transporter n=1 Tax=Methylopila jiangsuensis TaxID=586230 RepID=A0A9W6N4G3_9HYPH|nr:MFS transporter [Methylopila jiangsuensis]MDR6284497.1 MFS family permease [Methylopila jiangsuensis]GLK78114.1 MFS transporter [Methylopila jiangsuensis]
MLLLAACQGLFQTASVLVMTVGGLAGASLAADPAIATAPVASMFLGTAVATFPASMWMARVGRRPGFVLGASAGSLGGVVAVLGLWAGTLWVLCLGAFLVGVYQAFAQFYRFAAGEVSDDAFRPKAISLVLAGGVVAALAGPLLGRWGVDALAVPYAGSFAMLAALDAAAAIVLLALRVPRPTAAAVGEAAARPWREVVSQPAYLVALFGAATGYGIMILAMTATPIAMVGHHHDLVAASTVIQLHVLGMFLPSFFTGSLMARFGVLRIMLAGVCLLAGHVAMTATGLGFGSFASALVLLGIGWNFLYVGGTTLLTSTYRAAERGPAQATNDMTIFVSDLACSLGAGALLNWLGWQALNLALLPWLLIAAVAIGWLNGKQRSSPPSD